MEASRSFTPYNGTRGWGLSVCLVFLGLCALAQQRLVFRHLSVSEGLPNNNIQWIATDGFGMVWIATENGLARFDGSVTDVYKPGDTDSYGPAGGQVHFVGTVPGTHAVWTGATTGLSRFDQKTGRWYRVPLLYNETLGAPLPTYVYPFHIDDRGCVWMYIGHYGSICRYFPHTGRVETVTPGSNGRVYTPDPLYMPLRYTVSTLVHGIYYADYRSGKPEEKKRFAADPGFSFFAERAWYPHPDTLWLATDRGLVRCNPSADTWEAYPFPSEVTALAPDRKRPRYLWLGTRNDGIYRFDIREGRADFHALHDPENPYSIRSNRVTFLHTDSLDRLFAGLEGKGLAYADLSRPAFYSDFTGSRAETRGLANTVTHIFRSKNGEYLSGTSGSGLLAFTRDGRFLRKIAGIPGERVYSGIYAGDRLLVQTDGGFASYRPSGGRAEKLETSAPSRLHVMGWAALPDGTLYAGTDLGLFRAETGPGRIRFLPVPAVNDLLDYAYIQYIHNEGNTVYLKTNYTDWLVLAYESGRFRLLKKCTNQNYVVNDLIPTPGRRRFLLAATSAGIKTWDTQALDWVDNAVCRLNENTVSLSYDPRTGLWAATDNGLFLYDTEEGGFERFGVENGLSSEQFTPAKGMPGRRWMVWGSVNGITRISADGAPDSARNPRWTVKSAYVGTQKVPSFTPLYFLDTLEVPAGASGFSMDVSIQGIRPDNGGYLSSRLWGVDAAFKPSAGNSGSVSYNRLPPGDYCLEWTYRGKWPLRRVWTKKVWIRVEPAYYQTAGFRFGLVVLNLLIVWGVVRWILYRQKRLAVRRMRVMVESQENERARIAADLHDDLGGKLSTLKLLLEETGRQRPDLKNLSLYTGSLDMLDRSIGDLRTSLFNLNPRTLADSGVFPALAHLCRRIELSGGPHIRFEVMEDPAHRRSGAETETVVYRLVQELLNNTLKHAQATEIHIRFETDGRQLSIYYSDNGKGFDENAAKNGLGLQSIHTRVHLLDGSIRFRTSAGHGVKVSIFIPFIYDKPAE